MTRKFYTCSPDCRESNDLFWSFDRGQNDEILSLNQINLRKNITKQNFSSFWKRSWPALKADKKWPLFTYGHWPQLRDVVLSFGLINDWASFLGFFKYTLRLVLEICHSAFEDTASKTFIGKYFWEMSEVKQEIFLFIY